MKSCLQSDVGALPMKRDKTLKGIVISYFSLQKHQNQDACSPVRICFLLKIYYKMNHYQNRKV